MNELIVKQTLDSREVAEMMGIEHYKLLRKIEGSTDRKGYIQIITEAQMGLSEYFIKTSYKDASGKENKNYQIIWLIYLPLKVCHFDIFDLIKTQSSKEKF